MNEAQTKILENEINHTLASDRFLVVAVILDQNGTDTRIHVTSENWPLHATDPVLNKVRDQIFGRTERTLPSGIVVPGKVSLDRD